MLTPVKHRHWTRACFVLEQSRAQAVGWAPYASRWTLVFQHPLRYEIISQFCSHKNKGNAAISQALSVTYSLNPLLQISVFLSCYVHMWGLKTCHVSLLKALCFKTLFSLLPEAFGQNCGLLKNCFNTEAAECQEMGPCFWKKAPSLSHHSSCTHLEDIHFLLPSQPFNCASLLKKPLLWSTLEHLFLFEEHPPPWPDSCSAMGVLCGTSAGAISPSIHHGMCCSWSHNNSSQSTSFNSAWASHGEEITFYF